MPIHKGLDNRGHYFQFGNAEKYYYYNPETEHNAYNLAAKQGAAIEISKVSHHSNIHYGGAITTRNPIPVQTLKNIEIMKALPSRVFNLGPEQIPGYPVNHISGGDLNDVISDVLDVAPLVIEALPLFGLGNINDIQSVLVTNMYSKKQARKLVKDMGFKVRKIDIKKSFWRFRQLPPKTFPHYYNKILENYPGVELVIGYN
jgi:hypothetical protein